MNPFAALRILTSHRQAFRLAILMIFAAVAMLLSAAGQAPLTISHSPHIQAANAQDNAASYSTNWSGYATYQPATTFTDVKGSWVQPSVSCPSKTAQYASFWVGLDGYNSNSVEQIGTDSDCRGRNRPVYYAWYEMYPAYPVNLSMAVHPGDTMSAEVVTSGSTFTLTITNVTTGATFSTQQTAVAAADIRRMGSGSRQAVGSAVQYCPWPTSARSTSRARTPLATVTPERSATALGQR